MDFEKRAGGPRTTETLRVELALENWGTGLGLRQETTRYWRGWSYLEGGADWPDKETKSSSVSHCAPVNS